MVWSNSLYSKFSWTSINTLKNLQNSVSIKFLSNWNVMTNVKSLLKVNLWSLLYFFIQRMWPVEGLSKKWTNSCCVGAHHHSSTLSIESGTIKVSQRLFLVKVFNLVERSQELLVITQYKLKFHVILSNSLKKLLLERVKSNLQLFWKKLGRASEIGADIGSAAISKNPKTALSFV